MQCWCFSCSEHSGVCSGPVRLVPMDSELMAPQVLGPGEAPLTLSAAVGPLSGVCAHVSAQMAAPPEAPLALAAVVLLLRVCERVPPQLLAALEALLTLSAAVGLLSAVDPPVDLQPPRSEEALAALRAAVGSLAGVLLCVLGQVLLRREAQLAV